MYGYIYKFTFIPTLDWYVGKHKYLKCLELDPSYWGSGIKWNALISQYDKKEWPNLIKREIIEWCETEDQLNEQEIYWIAELDAINKGLNISPGGFGGGLVGEANGMYNVHRYGKDNPMYGKKHSKESKEAMSSKAKLRTGNKNSMYGKKHTNESKQKMSEAAKLKPPVSDDARKKMSISRTGKKHTEETKKKMSQNNGMNNPNYRLKVSIALKGKPSKARGKIWIHKDSDTKMILPSEYDTYANNGWLKGRK